MAFQSILPQRKRLRASFAERSASCGFSSPKDGSAIFVGRFARVSAWRMEFDYLQQASTGSHADRAGAIS
jgi:hypothetical protein